MLLCLHDLGVLPAQVRTAKERCTRYMQVLLSLRFTVLYALNEKPWIQFDELYRYMQVWIRELDTCESSQSFCSAVPCSDNEKALIWCDDVYRYTQVWIRELDTCTYGSSQSFCSAVMRCDEF